MFPEAMRPRWELYRTTVISDQDALVIRRSKVPLSRCARPIGREHERHRVVDDWWRDNHVGEAGVFVSSFLTVMASSVFSAEWGSF